MSTGRTWTLGEGIAVLITPDIGPAEHSNALRVGVGGAELNTAIGLARLGHPVTWVGVVGDDPWGRRIARELRAEGVNVAIRTLAGAFTGAYLRERRADGLARATYLRRGSAGSCLDRSDLADFNPSAGDVVHLTGVTAALSWGARRAWLAAAQQGRESGAFVSLDVNYRRALWNPTEAREAFNSIASACDLVLASIDEVGIFTGRTPNNPKEAAEVLRELLAPGAEIVIKNGAQGSLHVGADGTKTEGLALPVHVRDVVGAGDAFAAGYLSGVLDSASPAERLIRGHACAAFVVATDGDWEGSPRRSELALADTLLDLEVHR